MKQREECDSQIESMLCDAYSVEKIPEKINIRLKNQLACRKVMGTNKASFWWLPATISTVVSLAFSIVLCMVYLIVNIRGSGSWMPNLLQFASGIWLKVHLVTLVLEITASWMITFLGIWKGNLFRSARIF